MNEKKFYLKAIDMCCFCCHYKVFKKFKFNSNLGGDFYFLDKIRRSKQYKFHFVDINPGIWANYDGPKNGK